MSVETKLNALLSRLDSVKQTAPNKWLARCPAHNDKSPSLSIKVGSNGGILLYDFAGCSVESVLAAIGLTFADIFPDRLEPKYHGISGHDRYKARKETPKHSRYELFPKLVFEASILSIAIGDLLGGHTLTGPELARVKQAQDTILALRCEVGI